MMQVEIIYILPNDKGFYLTLKVGDNSTVLQVLTEINFFNLYPEWDREKNKVGIFGKSIALNHIVAEGDRLEIYRPIYVDVKIARRQAIQKAK